MADDTTTDQIAADGAVTEKTPVVIDLETTPEFQAWKQAKLTEVSNYLRDNWRIDAGVENLVMTPEFVFPDRENRKDYGSVSSGQSYRLNGVIAVNPATNKPMTYTIWRRINPPPAPALEPADVDTEAPTDAQ